LSESHGWPFCLRLKKEWILASQQNQIKLLGPSFEFSLSFAEKLFSHPLHIFFTSRFSNFVLEKKYQNIFFEVILP
jgi:hypothetical protein